jgi:predicted DNA-binding transcriptional regulator YafY
VNPVIAVERLEKIIALLLAHSEKGLRVGELAEACGVPLGIMQQDLKTLVNSTELQLPLYTDHDDLLEDSENLLVEPQVRWFLLKSEGTNPLIHLDIKDGLAVLDALNLIKDSPEKTILYEKILANFPLQRESNLRYIKGNMTPLQPINPELFLMIESAILQRRRIAMVYQGKDQELILGPLGLTYYSRLRCWYLVAQHEEKIKAFHLNRIQQVKKLQDEFNFPEGFNLKNWFSPRWGMEYGEPFTVKVRFSNRSQTFAKLKKDVAHRECRLIEEKESILFEDRIIGKNEFIAWVLGFGSAAEVLEPQELREEILERIQEALAR